MAKVFIPQSRDGIDISDAKRFGELVVLNEGGDMFYHTAAGVEEIGAKLKSITPDDWILLIGDPVAIAITSAIAGDLLGELRLLKWSRDERRYLPVTVAVDCLH